MVAVLGNHDYLKQTAGFNAFAATTLAQAGIKSIPKIDLTGNGPAPSQSKVDALGTTKKQLEGIVLAGKAQGADKPQAQATATSPNGSGGPTLRLAFFNTAMLAAPFGILPLAIGAPLAVAGFARAISRENAGPAPVQMGAAPRMDSRIKPSVGYFRDIPKPGQKNEVSAFGGYAGGGYGMTPQVSKRGSFAAQAAPIGAAPRPRHDYFSKPRERSPEMGAAFGGVTVSPKLVESAKKALGEVNKTVGGLEAMADKGGFSVTANLDAFGRNGISRRKEILMDGGGMTANEVGLDLDGLERSVGKRTYKPAMAFGGPFKAHALTLG